MAIIGITAYQALNSGLSGTCWSRRSMLHVKQVEDRRCPGYAPRSARCQARDDPACRPTPMFHVKQPLFARIATPQTGAPRGANIRPDRTGGGR